MYCKNIFIQSLCLFLLGCSNTPNWKTGLEGNPMPSFKLLLIDSTTYFNTDAIQPGKVTALFYFSPDCPYSRIEMKNIIDNVHRFKNIQFYALTTYSHNEMKTFYDYFHLQNYSNIVIGRDYEDYFSKYFTVPGVPYLAVYNRKKQLAQVFIGKVNIKEIETVGMK